MDPLPKSCDLSELIRGSESQNGMPSRCPPDPLPKGSPPKSHVTSLNQPESKGSAPDPLSGGDRERIPCPSKADR